MADESAQASNQLGEEWAALREEISNSKGARAHARIDMLVQGHGILTANHADLAAALDFFDTPEALPLWDTNHPERLDHFMNHVTRLLHNFVASAMSLVDHTRNVVRDNYADDDSLRVAYQAMVTRDFLAPLPQFVKCLRNYSLHYRLPTSSATMTFGAQHDITGKLGSAINLHREDLLAWDGWTREARQFLKDATETIDLRKVIADYLELIHQFYNWLINALNDKHAEDIYQTNALIDQEHKLLSREN